MENIFNIIRRYEVKGPSLMSAHKHPLLTADGRDQMPPLKTPPLKTPPLKTGCFSQSGKNHREQHNFTHTLRA